MELQPLLNPQASCQVAKIINKRNLTNFVAFLENICDCKAEAPCKYLCSVSYTIFNETANADYRRNEEIVNQNFMNT